MNNSANRGQRARRGSGGWLQRSGCKPQCLCDWPPGTGDDDGTDSVIGIGRFEHAKELSEHSAVEGIMHRGAIQRNGQNMALFR